MITHDPRNEGQAPEFETVGRLARVETIGRQGRRALFNDLSELRDGIVAYEDMEGLGDTAEKAVLDAALDALLALG